MNKEKEERLNYLMDCLDHDKFIGLDGLSRKTDMEIEVLHLMIEQLENLKKASE